MKSVKAEYDATENVLRLVEPLEGVADHAELDIVIADPLVPQTEEKTWMKLRGIMGEDGEDFARAINELFPPWND